MGDSLFPVWRVIFRTSKASIGKPRAEDWVPRDEIVGRATVWATLLLLFRMRERARYAGTCLPCIPSSNHGRKPHSTTFQSGPIPDAPRNDEESAYKQQ
jgi:hypothetical protein